MELMIFIFKLLIGFLVLEGVVFGILLLILAKGISISHKEDEERVCHESDRLSEED